MRFQRRDILQGGLLNLARKQILVELNVVYVIITTVIIKILFIQEWSDKYSPSALS